MHQQKRKTSKALSCANHGDIGTITYLPLIIDIDTRSPYLIPNLDVVDLTNMIS